MTQTPGRTGRWGDNQFTEAPIQECDYLIVLNGLEETLKTKCPTENIWHVVQEPPTERFKTWHIHPEYASKTFSCDKENCGSMYQQSHPMVPWHVNRDYDFLAHAPIPRKNRLLSWITSTKNYLDGQKKRMRFLSQISGKIDQLDLLGGGTYHITRPNAKERNEKKQKELGFQMIDDKWAGLAPYKYSLAIENFLGPDYWTEKIADCFLAWTVPIYYGCSNLEEYFPMDSFIRIDINTPDETIASINKILKEDSWEKRLPAIRKARDLVLNKHQLFPCISNHITKMNSEHEQ